MKDLRIWSLFGIFGAAMLVLAIWPGGSTRTKSVNLFGFSLLLFPLTSALLGFLCVFVPAHFGGLVWRHPEDATIIPMLVIPCLSWLAARCFGGPHVRRVVVSTGSLALLWIAAVTFGSRSEDVQSAGELIFWNTIILHSIGIIFGIVFAVAFGSRGPAEEAR